MGNDHKTAMVAMERTETTESSPEGPDGEPISRGVEGGAEEEEDRVVEYDEHSATTGFGDLAAGAAVIDIATFRLDPLLGEEEGGTEDGSESDNSHVMSNNLGFFLHFDSGEDYYSDTPSKDSGDVEEEEEGEVMHQVLKLVVAEGHFRRGVKLLKQRKLDEAIRAFTEAIRLDPTDSRFNNRGLSYLRKREYDLAIADYTEAIRLDPTKAAFFNNRGLSYFRKREYDLAIADYTEAIRLDPTNAGRFKNRGLSYVRKSEYDLAIADYTEVIRLHPAKGSRFFRRRADCLDKKREFDAAITDYSAAIRLRPKYKIALRRRVKSRCMKLESQRAHHFRLTSTMRRVFDEERCRQNEGACRRTEIVEWMVAERLARQTQLRLEEERRRVESEIATRVEEEVVLAELGRRRRAEERYCRSEQIRSFCEVEARRPRSEAAARVAQDLVFLQLRRHREIERQLVLTQLVQRDRAVAFRLKQAELGVEEERRRVESEVAVRIEERLVLAEERRRRRAQERLGRAERIEGYCRVEGRLRSEAASRFEGDLVFLQLHRARELERLLVVAELVERGAAAAFRLKQTQLRRFAEDRFLCRMRERRSRDDQERLLCLFLHKIRLDDLAPVLIKSGFLFQDLPQLLELEDALRKTIPSAFALAKLLSTIPERRAVVAFARDDAEYFAHQREDLCSFLEEVKMGGSTEDLLKQGVLFDDLPLLIRPRFEGALKELLSIPLARENLSRKIKEKLVAQTPPAAASGAEEAEEEEGEVVAVQHQPAQAPPAAAGDVGSSMREAEGASFAPFSLLPPALKSAPAPLWQLLEANVRVDLGQQLGRGAYGNVFKGELSVAVKRISLRSVSRGDVQKEVSLMEELNHPFVLKLHGCWFDTEHAWIVTDFCEKGDLSAFLEAEKPSAEERVRLLGNVASGMAFLHSKGVIHRDLKPVCCFLPSSTDVILQLNVLVTSDNVAKICDFGISTHDASLKSLSGTLRGTARFIAPRTPSRTRKQCDVYAFGILCYEVCSAKTTFAKLVEEYEGEQLVQAIRDHGKYPDVRQDCAGVSPKVQRAIESCWSSDPAEWKTFPELEVVFKTAVEPGKREF